MTKTVRKLYNSEKCIGQSTLDFFGDFDTFLASDLSKESPTWLVVFNK